MQKRFQKNDEPTFIAEFAKLLGDAKLAILTAHKNPDDDAIGSLLGLYHALRRDYPEVTYRMAYAGQRTERWAYFEGFEQIEFGLDPGSVPETDVVVMVDVSGWDRVSDVVPVACPRVVIDHHKSEPDGGIDLTYIDSTVSSCAQLIYRLFYRDRPLTARTAEVLLLGILGDTGSFSYINPEQTEAFLVAELLVREGQINIQAMKAHYMQYSETTFRLIQILMSHYVIEHDTKWGNYGYSFIDREEVLAMTQAEVEINAAAAIFVDSYTKSIQGVNWGFVVYPMLTEDLYKVSMRSLPQGINVRLLGQGLGNGGGHDLASGAKFKGAITAKEVIKTIETFMSQNEPFWFNR